ncbi:TPA: hypothetical protein ACNIDP_004697 [Klebsiella michiganensis]
MKDFKSSKYNTHLKILTEDAKTFEANKNTSFADQVLFDSLDSYISEIKGHIRDNEVKHPLADFLEMRLKGVTVDNGTIPLEMLSVMTQNISNLIQRATNKLTFGRDSHRVPKDIKQLLNLRLANILPGSTRLGISLNTGNSELFDTIPSSAMKEIFHLLESDSDNIFMDKVAEIGFSAAQSLKNIIEECQRNEVTLQLKWSGPFSNNSYSYLDTDRLAIFKDRLTSTRITQPQEEVLSGELALLSKYGKLEIEIFGEHVKASYPIDMLELLQSRYKVGQHIRLLVEITEIQNVTLGINKRNIVVKNIL